MGNSVRFIERKHFRGPMTSRLYMATNMAGIVAYYDKFINISNHFILSGIDVLTTYGKQHNTYQENILVMPYDVTAHDRRHTLINPASGCLASSADYWKSSSYSDRYYAVSHMLLVYTFNFIPPKMEGFWALTWTSLLGSR